MEVPKDKMEQKRKAYNENQAGIRSSAPYDWSVETCTKYSGVTKHIFHNVLKEPYCTKDQNNSYGIPSELGAFVCAYAYAVKSYKDCSEKDPRLAPHLRKFFEKHREILRNLEKEQRGEYERYLLGSNPDYQFLSSYSSFIDCFSDKLATLFSIINDFPVEARLEYMQGILTAIDAEIESIIYKNQEIYNSPAPNQLPKDNLSLKALFHHAYERNAWRHSLQDLFEHTNDLPKFKAYAENVTKMFSRKDRPPEQPVDTHQVEKLRLAAERVYHQKLVEEFLTENEIETAKKFFVKQQKLEAFEIEKHEKKIREFLYSVTAVLTQEPALKRFSLPESVSSSKIPVSTVCAIGAQIISDDTLNVANASFLLITSNLPTYMKEYFSAVFCDIQSRFGEFYTLLVSALSIILPLEEATDPLYYDYPPAAVPKILVLLNQLLPGLEKVSVEDAVKDAENILLQQKALKEYYEPLFREKVINRLHQSYRDFIAALSRGETHFSYRRIHRVSVYLKLQLSIMMAEYINQQVAKYLKYYADCDKIVNSTIISLKKRNSYQAFETQFHNLMYEMLFSDDQFEINEDDLPSE